MNIEEVAKLVHTEDRSGYPWCRNCEHWDCWDGREIHCGLTTLTVEASATGDCLNEKSPKHGTWTRSWGQCDEFSVPFGSQEQRH
jgi:hypothetical protein